MLILFRELNTILKCKREQISSAVRKHKYVTRKKYNFHSAPESLHKEDLRNGDFCLCVTCVNVYRIGVSLLCGEDDRLSPESADSIWRLFRTLFLKPFKINCI